MDKPLVAQAAMDEASFRPSVGADLGRRVVPVALVCPWPRVPLASRAVQSVPVFRELRVDPSYLVGRRAHADHAGLQVSPRL
jgi:hypothetical protein